MVTKRFSYIPVNQISRIIKELDIKPTGLESVPTQEACGRILANDILASHDVPYCNYSHFDGYAIRSKDTINASPENPIHLTVKGNIYPRQVATDKINPGEAYYIATGAFLPDGSDTVVAVENVIKISEKIIVAKRRIKVGEHIIPAGEDIKKGETVFRKGQFLDARHIAFLIYLDINKVTVMRKPVVSLISTGDELVNDTERKSYKIVNSHNLLLSDLVSKAGGRPADFGVVSDDPVKIGKKIRQNLQTTDMTITIGGTSMGKKDFVPESIKMIGGKILLHGIKRKPGRVTGLSTVDNKPVVMLPGLIQSTIIGCYTLVMPLIRCMLGTAMFDPWYTIKAVVTHHVSWKNFISFQRAVFVRIERNQNKFSADPIMGESPLFSSIVKADGFTIIPENKQSIEKEEEVEVYLFPDFYRARYIK